MQYSAVVPDVQFGVHVGMCVDDRWRPKCPGMRQSYIYIMRMSSKRCLVHISMMCQQFYCVRGQPLIIWGKRDGDFHRCIFFPQEPPFQLLSLMLGTMSFFHLFPLFIFFSFFWILFFLGDLPPFLWLMKMVTLVNP